MPCMSRLTQSRSLSTVMGRPERRRKNGVNRNTPQPWAVARRSRSRVARLPQPHFATCEPRFIRSTLLLGRHRPLCTARLEPPARLLQHSTDTSNACRDRFRRADPEDCGRPRRRPPVSRRASTVARPHSPASLEGCRHQTSNVSAAKRRRRSAGAIIDER